MSTTVAAASPAWTIPDYLEVREGHLAINGADALELVRQLRFAAIRLFRSAHPFQHQPA